MNYLKPHTADYPDTMLAELTGPVETQYITDLQVPEAAPGSEFEFCVNYASEGCKGGELVMYFEPLMKGGAQEAQAYPPVPLKEGKNCIEVAAGCGPYRFTVYALCNGRQSNKLSDEIYLCAK